MAASKITYRDNFPATIQKVFAAVGAGLYAEGLHVIRYSLSNHLVPVDTGRLAGSRFVTLPDTKLRLLAGFGVNYAFSRHEIDQDSIANPAVEGASKYLEIAIDATDHDRAGRIGRTVSRHLRAGTGVRIAQDPTIPKAPRMTLETQESFDKRQALRAKRNHGSESKRNRNL